MGGQSPAVLVPCQKMLSFFLACNPPQITRSDSITRSPKNQRDLKVFVILGEPSPDSELETRTRPIATELTQERGNLGGRASYDDAELPFARPVWKDSKPESVRTALDGSVFFDEFSQTLDLR